MKATLTRKARIDTMGLKELIILLVALMPTIASVIHNVYVVVKQSKLYNKIAETYDLAGLKNKMDKQIKENEKTQAGLKALYKTLYKYAYGVELTEDDINAIITKNAKD